MKTTLSLLAFGLCIYFASCKKNNSSAGISVPPYTYDFVYSYNVAGYPIAFYSNDTANYIEYWDFGDGETAVVAGSTATTPITHKYTKIGSFTAGVTINGHLVQKVLTIIPDYFFNINGTPIAGDTLYFALPYLPPAGTVYAWNFGDGTTSSGSTPWHAYRSAGRYSLSLQLDNKTDYSYALPVTVVNDPLHTHAVARTRRWAGALSNVQGSCGTLEWPADTSFAIGYIDELKLSLLSIELIYNPDSSTAADLVFTSTYDYYQNYFLDINSEYFTAQLHYYVANDSITLHERYIANSKYPDPGCGYDINVHTY